MHLQDRAGIARVLPAILEGAGGVPEFDGEGKNSLLSARYVQELKWVLVVEQSTDRIMEEFRATLQKSLVICALVTLLVVLLILWMINTFHRRLVGMALIDGLTGVANRHAFTMSFTQALANARRKKESMSVLMIDIDHFKSINDRFGHLTGDQILQDMASLVKQRIRGWDILCRWGGEEFLVLLQGADLAGAGKVAEQLRAEVQAAQFGQSGKTMQVTISIGVAQYRDGDSEVELTGRADRALYRAKANGRNRVEGEETPSAG
jgi:diguanylate cyclase (GGDEF)-like protein